jgi:hypothetical protein
VEDVAQVSLDSSHVAALVGDYTTTVGKVDLLIRHEGSRLTFEIPKYFPAQELIPESPSAFVASDLGWHVRAKPGVGNRDSLEVMLDSTDTIFAIKRDRRPGAH